MYKHLFTLSPLLFLSATSLTCVAGMDTTESKSAEVSQSAGQAIATQLTSSYNNVVANCGEGEP